MYKYLVIGKNINLCIISLLFLSGSFFVPKAFAKTITQSLSVSPVINEVTLTPGKKTTFPLTITNNADIPLGVRMSVSGFDENHTGIQIFQQNDSPMIGWTNITPATTVIDPHQNQTLDVQITPPKNLSDGGYYATIFLTPFIAKPQDALGPIILTRVGILVLATSGPMNYHNLAQKVQINNFSIASVWKNQPATTVQFTVKNTYFAHFSAKPFLTLTPLFGKPQQYTLDEKHILPTKSKQWQTGIMIPPSWMIYKAHLAVSVGQGNYLYANTFFIVAPAGLFIRLICSFIFFILLIILLRKRLHKTIHIVLKGK